MTLDVSFLSRISQFKWPKQRRWVILLVLLLGGSGLFAARQLVRGERSQPTPTLSARRQSLPITVPANGTVKASQTINLSPKSAGYLKQLLVQEGSVVKQGQVLAYMDDSNLQGQLTQARAQVSQAQARLQKIQSGNRSQEIAQAEAQLAEAQANLTRTQNGNRSEEIAQAQARLAQAQAKLRQSQTDFGRYQDLERSGAIARSTLDQKRADLDTAQAQVREAEAGVALQVRGARSEDLAQAQAQVQQRQQALDLLQAGSRPEDIADAAAQLESAKGGLQTIEAQINDTVIKAPFDGVVTKKYAEVGTFVTPTTAGSAVEGSASNSILTLSSVNQVVANVNESSLPQIKLGQPVVVKADAYPNQSFQGRVAQIAAQASTVQNVTSFEIKVSLDATAAAKLRAGMNVTTEFQVGQLDNAIVVPAIAIVRNQGNAGVYVMEQGKPVFRPIQVGITVNNQTEVKSGLNGDEAIALNAPTAAKEPPRSGLLPKPPEP
jgi:HlyD family secretion protein